MPTVRPELAARIDRDLREGSRVGVRGTPCIYVDGRLLQQRSLPGFRPPSTRRCPGAAEPSHDPATAPPADQHPSKKMTGVRSSHPKRRGSPGSPGAWRVDPLPAVFRPGDPWSDFLKFVFDFARSCRASRLLPCPRRSRRSPDRKSALRAPQRRRLWRCDLHLDRYSSPPLQ